MAIQKKNLANENAKQGSSWKPLDTTLASRDERRRRQFDRMKADILKSAVEVFAQNGFSTTTMHDIAKAAGFGAASLYTYFKTKEEILAEVIAQTFAAMKLVYSDSVSASIPVFSERVLDLMLRKINFVESNGVLPKLIQSGVVPTAVPGNVNFKESSPPQVIRTLMAEWFANFTTAVERFGREPNECAHFLSTLLRSIVEEMIFGNDKSAQKENRETLVKVTLDFYLAGLAGLNTNGVKI